MLAGQINQLIYKSVKASISIARVVRVAKFVDGITLNIDNKKYNLAGFLLDSNNSNISKLDKVLSTNNISIIPSFETAIIYQTIDILDILDKLCMSCIRNKLSQIIRRNKSMTITITKLEKIFADL